MHSVDLVVEDEDGAITHILCICGELFLSHRPPSYEWAVILMSQHLKEMNKEVQQE